MKSVGEVMAIGRTFKEAMMKAVRSLETGKKATADDIEPRRLTQRLVTPHPDRLSYIRYAFEKGMTVREVARMTSMDPWFLYQIKQITDEIKAIGGVPMAEITAEQLRAAKRMGISDERPIAAVMNPFNPELAPPVEKDIYPNWRNYREYSGGMMTNFGTLGGAYSVALGINNYGQIIGQAYPSGSVANHAFLYSGGAMSDLGTLGGTLPVAVLRLIARGSRLLAGAER